MKERTITYVGGAIIVLLLITTGIGFISNSRNKKSLNEERLQKEALTSQKLLVSQDLDKVKSDLTALTAKQESTEKALAETESKLAEKGKRIAFLSRENKSLMKDSKELAELQKSKSDLDRVYADLKLEHETALSRIKELENTEIRLDAEKKELTSKLAASEMYRTDNIEIFGSRGNKKDKLTFVASRTKRLNLNFEVPQNLTESISFKIITPSGTTITPEDKSLSWIIDYSSRDLTASLSWITGNFENSRKVLLTYNSKEKLMAGEYKIQIFSKDMNIGNCRIKLR